MSGAIHNTEFYKFAELTQVMVEKLRCPFKDTKCKGKWCMAWRKHSEDKGYCKLIEK